MTGSSFLRIILDFRGQKSRNGKQQDKQRIGG